MTNSMNQGYFNNRIQVIHNKGKAIIIPKRGMLFNSKAPPIPTSPMTRINRVILKEESSFISLEVSMSFAILWPNWLRLTPYTSYGS